MARRVHLTDARARAAQPREREYAVHDATLQGFILRVQPGGARSWVCRFRRDGRPRRVTLGPIGTLTAERARAAALALLAREKGGGQPVPVPPSGPTLARFALEYLERRSPAWKPNTRRMVETYLRSSILPALGSVRVDAAARTDVARWFHAYGRRHPGGANRCHAILRDMFARAADWGHRPEAAGNPCHGIVRYRRPPRGRLLGAEDLAKLGATLRRLHNAQPVHAAAVRLILLTGCRPGEIRRLRWSEVKADRLMLAEAKTGPRPVLLGESAQALLRDLASKAAGEWVFPGAHAGEPLKESALYYFWNKVRVEAGIVADARLYDLRHAHASHAVMSGESLYTTGRLLGHRSPTTTNRYAHLDDATLGGAVERVAAEVQRKLAATGARHPRRDGSGQEGTTRTAADDNAPGAGSSWPGCGRRPMTIVPVATGMFGLAPSDKPGGVMVVGDLHVLL